MTFVAWLNIMCLRTKYASAEERNSNGCKLGMTESDMLQIINIKPVWNIVEVILIVIVVVVVVGPGIAYLYNDSIQAG